MWAKEEKKEKQIQEKVVTDKKWINVLFAAAVARQIGHHGN